MKKKILLIIIMSIIFSSSIIAFSFFNNMLSKTIEATYDGENIVLVNIDTLDKFYDYINDDCEIYNSKVNTSNVRYNLVFTENLNIIATNDIYITSDCNINFNTNSLDLNGYNLIIKNSYSAEMIFYNGRIINSNSNSNSTIFIDTNNSFVNLNLNIDESIMQKVVSADENLLRVSALNYALLNMQHYDSFYISNLYNTSELGWKSINCPNNHTSNCIYTYDDLDFLYNYKGYNITFKYESSDESILKNYGNVLKTGVAELEISIFLDGEQIGDKYKLYIHVISSADDLAMSSAAINTNLQYLNKYMDTTNNEYKFVGPVMLPSYDSYFDCELSYEIFKGNLSLGISGNSAYFEKVSDCYVFNATSTITSMNISSTRNEETSEYEITTTNNSSLVDPDNNDIVDTLVSNYYNNKIVVTKTNDNDNPLIVDTYQIIPSTLLEVSDCVDYIGYDPGITRIDYEILNNNVNTYEIGINSGVRFLKVIGTEENNNEPSTLDNVVLKATFTFDNDNKPEVVSKTINIIYVENETEDVSVSPFRPYYLYYDRLLKNLTMNYTYKDFILPLTVGNDFPIYYLTYKIYDKDGAVVTDEYLDCISIYLVDSAGNKPNNTTISSDNFKSLDPSTLGLYASGGYSWYFDIEQWNLPENDLYLEFEYHYAVEKNNPIFEEADPTYISKLTIPGIVRCDDGTHTSQRFTDIDLYKDLYYIYHNNEDYENINVDNFIITSRLSQVLGNVTINDTYKDGTLTFADRTDISSYKGIELLTGIEKLNMSKSGLVVDTTVQPPSIPDIDYIAQMTSLKELNLSNNNLTDCNQGTLGLPSNNNNFISKLQTLTKLERLDLSNNKIYYFDDLSLLSSLKYVNVKNNSTSYSWTILGFNVGAQIITPLLNSLYGSNGAMNQATYSNLMANGVDIEGYDSTAVDSVNSKIILTLKNIEYQEKLPQELTVDYAYYYLSDNVSDYDLPTSYPITVTGGLMGVTITQVGSPILKYSDVDDDTFKITLTYNFRCSSIGSDPVNFPIIFQVEHDVIFLE